MNSKAVNRPTDPKLRDQDIATKLQLYGIYSAFANGKLPSNKQIDIALNSAIAHRALNQPSKRLSSEGQQLVTDLKGVIEQAKVLFLTKNQGNLLQDFIWHCEQIGGGNAYKPGAPVDKQTAQQQGQEALEGLRTLGTLIISNGQFRKLLNDATILLRDIAGDAASKAATRIQPSEDELNQIDRPADDNTWHDVPSVSGLKDRARDEFNKQKPFSAQDMRDAAGDATQSAHPSGSRDPRDAANLAQHDAQQGTASGMDAKSGANAGISTLKDRASANVPEQTKDRARNAIGQTREFFDSKMPHERRQQAIYRLKKMVVEIQSHQDYQRAIETFLHLAETYGGYAQNVTQQTSGSVRGAHSDDHLRIAEADLKTLIERFANYTSSDDLFDSINAIYRDAERDPELKGWFRSITAYVRKCLAQEGYIMRDEATNEWNRLYDQGQYLTRDRYRDHFNRILDEIKFMAEQFDEDPLNKQFGQSMQKLFFDLGNDENGKPTFKPHLVKDLTNVILPSLFESIAYVPLPRIEYSDPMMDAVVENLVLEGDNLMPNVFEFGTDNYVRWGRKQVASKLSSKTLLSVSGVQVDLRDVSYYVHKKQGFPKITDTGLCDVFMGGQGFSFKVKMATAEKTDRQHFFKIEKIDVDVKNLNIKLKQSKYKLPFTIFKPLLFKVIRPVIQKVLEKQIRDSVTRADAIAYSIHKEAETNARRTDPTNVSNIYQRYYEAAQKRFLQGKEKSKAAAQDKKVNLAVTQKDSIFPDVKLPGGISTKATEYKELAAKGDNWESPIFGIGSARETSSFPPIPQVQRKPHRTAKGTVGTGGTSGFSSQVDQSFGGQQDLSLGNRANGTLNGASGYPAGQNANNYDGGYPSTSPSNTATGVPITGGTLFGANNPVLTGAA